MIKPNSERNIPLYSNISTNTVYFPEFRELSLIAKVIYILLLIGIRKLFLACSAFCDIFPIKIKRFIPDANIADIEQALYDLENCGKIKYDPVTGDLHVTDFWISNLYACNGNTIIGYRRQLQMLDLTNKDIINLASADIDKAAERFDSKEKESPYFVKMYADVIWSKEFAELTLCAKLVYLILYIGLEKGCISTGYYVSTNEYDIAAVIGDNVPIDNIANALQELHEKKFIYYDTEYNDIYVFKFTESNYYATSYAKIAVYKENFLCSRIHSPQIQGFIDADIIIAEKNLFKTYPKIKKIMETKGYKSTNRETNTVYLYKLNANGNVVRTICPDETDSKEENIEIDEIEANEGAFEDDEGISDVDEDEDYGHCPSDYEYEEDYPKDLTPPKEELDAWTMINTRRCRLLDEGFTEDELTALDL